MSYILIQNIITSSTSPTARCTFKGQRVNGAAGEAVGEKGDGQNHVELVIFITVERPRVISTEE